MDSKKDLKISGVPSIYIIADSHKQEDVIYAMYFNQRYVCIGGSIESFHGEFRTNMLDWTEITTFLKKNPHINEIYQFIKIYLKNAFMERELSIGKELALDFFTIAWFNFYYEYITEMPYNLNKTFSRIMTKYKKEDISIFKSIMVKFKPADIETFSHICQNKVGQKITMLYKNEIKNMYNIEYNIWLELEINKRLSKYTGFPTLFSNFLIKGKNYELFDNPWQYKKLDYSDNAIKIEKLLDKAIKLSNSKNYRDDTTYLYEQEDTVDILNPLRNNLKSVKKKTADFILSDTSINMISEYLGKTIYDNSKLDPEIFTDKNYANFEKYMFEICRNIYYMNTKAHAIHGDLHLNNIILSRVNNTKKETIYGNITFTINKKQYTFQNNYKDICFIDFNRSIINPDNYKSQSKGNLLNIQVNALLDYLLYVKSDYEEIRSDIEQKMKFHFAEFFKILTALDPYIIMTKLIVFTETLNAKNANSYKKCKNLMKKIKQEADIYLTLELDNLINNKYTDMEWPIVSIIENIWGGQTISGGQTIQES